jgi:hypothetical protein
LRRLLLGLARWGPTPVTLAILWLCKEVVEQTVVSLVGRIWRSLGFPEIGMTTAWWIGAVAISLTVGALVWIGIVIERTRKPRVYVSRDTLDHSKRHGGYPLDEAETGHCVWLYGGKQFDAGASLDKIQKLIFPDPDCDSTIRFQNSVSRQTHADLCHNIKQSTKTALEKNIPVKWYPGFIGSSWWIGDRDKDSAFIHFEILMPYSESRKRPSMRIYRWQSEEAYTEHCRVFDELWDGSRVPTMDEVDGTRKTSKP